MLIGLETKNAILVVEFGVELMEKQGMSIIDSAKEAARQRLRPILMTSFAFIMGVLPMARATGAGAYSRNSLGIVIASGMLISTILGRFVIPVYYVLGERIIRYFSPPQRKRASDWMKSTAATAPIRIKLDQRKSPRAGPRCFLTRSSAVLQAVSQGRLPDPLPPDSPAKLPAGSRASRILRCIPPRSASVGIPDGLVNNSPDARLRSAANRAARRAYLADSDRMVIHRYRPETAGDH